MRTDNQSVYHRVIPISQLESSCSGHSLLDWQVSLWDYCYALPAKPLVCLHGWDFRFPRNKETTFQGIMIICRHIEMTLGLVWLLNEWNFPCEIFLEYLWSIDRKKTWQVLVIRVHGIMMYNDCISIRCLSVCLFSFTWVVKIPA